MAYALTPEKNSIHRSEDLRLILQWVSSLENSVTRAITGTVFSENIVLGRIMALVLLIFQTKVFVYGSLGAILTAFFGRNFTKNKTLQNSGLFPLNGLFIGLATSTFLSGHLKTVIAVFLMSLVTSLAVLVSHRFLKTWDLPVLVAPYCISFWLMQLVSHESKVFYLTVDPQILNTDRHAVLQVLHGALISFGQIFFSGNLISATIVACIIVAFNPKKMLSIACSALLPTVISYLCIGNHWSINSGLTAFSGILLFQAFNAGHLAISPKLLWTIIGLSGLVEVAALKIAESQALFALSASYIAVFWVAKLCEETKQGRTSQNQAIMTW